MINLHNLSFAYPEKRPILNDVNLKINTGTFNIFYGPTGNGKTTLLKLIAGLYPLHSNGKMNGKIESDGKASMMFQDPNFQFAMKTVAEEFQFTLGNLQVSPKKMEQKMNEALAFCGISELANRELLHLSGGEKQKVALAIIIAMDYPIILLDEPFTNVDSESKKDILDKLNKLKKEKQKTIIISDHRIRNYFKIADHFYLVKNGSVTPLTDKEIHKEAPFVPKSKPHYQIMTTNDPIYQLFNYSLTTNNKNLIEPENIDLYPGITYISGQNGVGKTTFLETLCRMHSYNGTIRLLDHNIQNLSEEKLLSEESLVFQRSEDQFLKITVKDDIELAKKHSLTKSWPETRIKQLCDKLGLTPLENQIVYSLSGGQQKKLQIAVMLIRDTQIMMLDEPFAGLDDENSRFVTYLLEHEANNGKSILFTSHIQNQLTDNADFKIELAKHRLTYQGGKDEA